MLADFGALLRAELRGSDFAGRFGGEEFMLLLPDTSVSTASVLLRRLHKSWALLAPEVTFSTGVAQCTKQLPVQDVVAAADQALYVAKTAGRNRDCTLTSTPTLKWASTPGSQELAGEPPHPDLTVHHAR